MTAAVRFFGAAAEQARLDLERYTGLAERGFATTQRLQESRAVAAQTEAAVAQARAALEAERRAAASLGSARAQSLAQSVLDHEQHIFERFQSILDRKIAATRIRCHGDYHLGQVLHTGNDFVIIDFEGEPARSLSERRIKRSPLQDVAGMVRSLHYAASQGVAQLVARGLDTPENIPRLRQAAAFWYFSCTAAFLQAYRTTAAGNLIFPSKREEQDLLLNFHLLEKAIYEMGYELNNRPDWVETPLTGIIDLLAVPV